MSPLAALAVLLAQAFTDPVAERIRTPVAPRELAPVAWRFPGCRLGPLTPIRFHSPDVALGVRHHGMEVTLVRRETDPGTGAWQKRSDTYATSFQVAEVAVRLDGELFVAGYGPWNEVVIERWTLGPETVGFRAVRPRPPHGVGHPAPYVSTTFDLDGPYFPPDERERPNAERTELYRGNDIDRIHAMVADPDGRFVLVLDWKYRLFRLTTDDVPVLDLLFTAEEIPHLAICDSLTVKQHAREGRVVLLDDLGVGPRPDLYNHRTLLRDADNDGRFEGHETFDADGWFFACYERDGWLDHFTTYR